MTAATLHAADLHDARRARLLANLHDARWSGDADAWSRLLERLVTLERDALTDLPHPAQRRRAVEAMARDLLQRWLDAAQHPHDAEPPEHAADRDLILAQVVALAAAPAPDGAPSPAAEIAARFHLNAVDLWMLLTLHLAAVDPFFRRACADGASPEAFAPDAALLCGMLLGRPGPLWALGRQRLHPNAPLRRHALIELDPRAIDPSAAPLRLASSLVNALDGAPSLAEDLAPFAALTPHDAPLTPGADALASPQRDGLADALRAQTPLLTLTGLTDHGRHAFVAAAARDADLAILTLDPTRLPEHPEHTLTRALRDARLLRALLLLPLDHLPPERAALLAQSAARIASQHPHAAPLLIAMEVGHGEAAAATAAAPSFALPSLDEAARALRWRHALLAHRLEPQRALLAQLARHPLAFDAIGRAADDTAAHLDLHPHTPISDAAERAVQRQLLARPRGLTDLVPPRFSWADLVLPADLLDQLMEIISFARYRDTVLHTWGFDAKLPYGRALTALLYGAPGTGKTMVASLIARELGKPLLRVNLAEVTSKWIGESEKNLALVFEEATRHDAVLLFDEADSLFGKRTEVKTSNDRYANMNVNFLLQTLEAFEGVVLLTTNLDASIDDAFKRRLRFKIAFDAPGPDERARLWAAMLPPQAQVAPDLRFDALAQTFDLSGGYIKEAVLRAAFTAAERGEPIAQDMLWHAAERIYRELGRVVRAKKP